MRHSGFLLVMLAAALAGCGGGDAAPVQRSPISIAEGRVEAVATKDVDQAAAHPDEWIVYSDCDTPRRCTAELRYEGLPTEAMAVDHYSIKQGKAIRRGPAHIEVTFTTDAVGDCTGRCRGSGDPGDLMECASR